MTEIVKHQGLPPINEYIQIAEKLAMTSYFIDEDGVINKEVQVARGFAKIMYGHELGLSPMFSMQHVNIIKGKMTLDAGGVAHLVASSSKYNYKILYLEEDGCELQFFRGEELLGTSKWGKADAERAGLLKPNSNYAKFPKDMYFARAMTSGARRFTPDIFGGSVYTPEELGQEPETEVSYTVEPQKVNQITAHESPAIQDASFSDKERKNFHAIGSMVYGEEWDERRHILVSAITNGRTESSQDLTRSEMLQLIKGMEEKQSESIPQTGIEAENAS